MWTSFIFRLTKAEAMQQFFILLLLCIIYHKITFKINCLCTTFIQGAIKLYKKDIPERIGATKRERNNAFLNYYLQLCINYS